jgi:thiopeptide-type bacteriocin biosynthesis protein
MDYIFSDYLILRIPAKSTSDYQDADLQTLLNDKAFQAALYIASPLFFIQLKKMEFRQSSLNKKEINTVRKYWNRMCFRPTPFGLFSSITLLRWADKGPFQAILKEKPKVNLSLDQRYTALLSEELLNNELSTNKLFILNPLFYRINNEYRFLRTEIVNNYNKRVYILQSIESSIILRNLITFCAIAREKAMIIQFIKSSTSFSYEESQEYFNYLTEAQILTSTLQINITGEDYLNRLLKFGSGISPQSARWQKLKEVHKDLRSEQEVDQESLASLNKKLIGLLENKPLSFQENQLNVVLENQLTNMRLDINYQSNVNDAMFALNRLIPGEPLILMNNFLSKFLKLYDQQSIPLLHVLDPELGIDYLNNISDQDNSLLLNLKFEEQTAERVIKWTSTHSYLMKCWHQPHEDILPVIKLEKQELEKLNISDDADKQLLGISVLFRTLGKKIWIESAGGINAPALIGRFTLINEEIATAAKNMAKELEATNPDVIFAELVHLSDPHVDNVNRRANIWSYEIPVTTVSLFSSANQISLSDIYVSVVDNKVVLRSLKHKKIIIPRLTSAYNYHNNTLPLFRFLCDIQYQYGKSNFTLELSQFFPNLLFYPRVEYKDTILHLATWILTEAEIQLISKADQTSLLPLFNQLADKLHLPENFSLVQHDQQLVFCRNRLSDLKCFTECIKKRSSVILKEHLEKSFENGFVQNKDGRGYIGQFNAFLYSNKPIKLQQKHARALTIPPSKRLFMPGSEWLYLKIYVSKNATNRLLANQIYPLILRLGKQILNWFYVFYEDTSPHIRLRLQISIGDLGEILIIFKQKLGSSVYQHLIREYQIDTYKRELERYNPKLIIYTEDFFNSSSELIINFIRNENSKNSPIPPYQLALVSVNDILKVVFPKVEEKITFTAKAFQSFLYEIKRDRFSVEMDQKFRELRQEIKACLSDPSFYTKLELDDRSAHFHQKITALNKATRHIKASEKGLLVSSWIHMHLNRLFIEHSRKQEMIIYYLLNKHLVSEKAKKDNRL